MATTVLQALRAELDIANAAGKPAERIAAITAAITAEEAAHGHQPARGRVTAPAGDDVAPPAPEADQAPAGDGEPAQSRRTGRRKA